MPKHNNAVPNVHHRKEWQLHVRTWFNQPGRKHRRQTSRQDKVIKNGVKPTDLLRPIVHCPTQKYNFKARAGRGFSIEELKGCNLTVAAARTIGISVDPRRKNRSEESLKMNVNRLKTYMSKLVVFPRGSKAKKGFGGIPNDTLRTDMSDRKLAKSIASVMPITNYKRMLV
eukprot:Gregarina_sp_Poly_1__8301@NODE_484_length_8016_cov_113_227827_g391_i0_p4_GENE_NODE_484_length_8016_cov_113_227827_g391_i0NODE_484_length_8016_cov_113_227827_g391_i0_p4_ORF_typecomplete_len171_score12_54Ribosomal_L13e/PF01294_18/3_5e43Rieske_2/PF13806_6/0_025Bromo_coat/PF01318_18/0_09_NODE_484_length_8016_cov_113_227827_g391_i042214733